MLAERNPTAPNDWTPDPQRERYSRDFGVASVNSDALRRRKRRHQSNLAAKNPSTPTPEELVAAMTAAVVIHAGHMK